MRESLITIPIIAHFLFQVHTGQVRAFCEALFTFIFMFTVLIVVDFQRPRLQREPNALAADPSNIRDAQPQCGGEG